MKNLMIITLLLSGFSLLPAQKNETSDIKVKRTATRTLDDESSPHFMQFGIMSRNHDEFKKKYGIAVIYQNCVISQFLSKKAKENNLLIAKQLTEKHGEGWKKDLGFIPYGL
ncbi:hypothetical protein OMO38_08855 [Chryseobacterium sp. 09-1422]|jgi:hypothetical protein|uniref:Beta-lactamase-related domain-containing protein n=1 Tax=Chryseobacterium kimseyorum TaxID=2984028 RepID=A0ABT3HXZ4_9FLAO|nr:hypothetical protein [Chryseobacterium kimseyorum]MCW3168636.1 hypothetical protein [Chryseobacterium kimseyorum]